METLFGFRLPVAKSIERDLSAINKFAPPDGRLLLAFVDDRAIGVVCLQRIGPLTAEVKRMYVEPVHRGTGVGRALLDQLLVAAAANKYERVRLDSPSFMTDAHRLYRAAGFVDIEPYAESEIPDQFKDHWLFMERRLS